MANMPGFGQAVEMARDHPRLGVGVHLVLTSGKPIGGPYQTLTDERGMFLKNGVLEEKAKCGEINLREVEDEYRWQIEKVLQAGLKPTHLDSHHHSHQLPGIIGMFGRVAAEYQLPVRLTDREGLPEQYQQLHSPDQCHIGFYDENVSAEYLCGYLDGCGADEIVEVMCHPAYLDQEILNGSSYNIKRTKELAVLRSIELIRYIEEHEIVPDNYTCLTQEEE